MTGASEMVSEWMPWPPSPPRGYVTSLPPLKVRREADLPDGRPVARLRMEAGDGQANFSGALHGGAALCFIDVALFAAAHQFGLEHAIRAVTLDLATQFVGAGRVGEPLDAVVDLVRETGRLMFVRGLLVQGEGDSHIVASFAATIRKASNAPRVMLA